MTTWFQDEDNRTMKKHTIAIFVSLLYTFQTFGVTYNYTTLIFLDYETLKPIVTNSLEESRQHKYPDDGDKAVSPLSKTFKMLLSRPDNDGLLRKLSPNLVSEMNTLGVFETVVGDLLQQGQDEVADETLDPKVRTTALIMLNNLLLTVRPLTLDNTDIAKEVCQFADKNLKIPKAVQRNAKLTTMFNSTKPTDLAKKIMMWYAKKKNKDVQAKTDGCPFSKKA